MKKRALSLVMTFALLLGLLSTTAGAAVALTNDASLDANEREILRLTNVYRAGKGLPLLSNTANIQKAANQRAQELLTLYSHDRPDGSSWTTALSAYKHPDLPLHRRREHPQRGKHQPGGL